MMIENGFLFFHISKKESRRKERKRKKNVFSNLFTLSIIVCAVVNIDIIDDHFDVRDGFVDAVDCVDIRVDFVDVVRFDVRLDVRVDVRFDIRFDVRFDVHDDFVDVVY